MEDTVMMDCPVMDHPVDGADPQNPSCHAAADEAPPLQLPQPELRVSHPEPLDSAPPPAAPAAPAPVRVVEALLLATDAPLSAARLADLIGGLSATEARLLIAELNDRYVASSAAFRIEELAGGYQLLTLPEFAPWLRQLDQQRGRTRLSDAALETLAIVAYRQPVIRADVESIRGVACGDVLTRLRDMGLIKMVGRAEVVGRPVLYGTTRKFLDVFGLADLGDLPSMDALSLKRAVAAPPPREELPPEPRQAAAGA